MSWYRTYRPQTVAGLHISTVREALLSMLKSGSIPHALLFAGSKGTGKTSSARIIAKVLNCEKNAKRKAGKAFQEPCNTCDMCLSITSGGSLNVVEMDGASNRRIDDIRDLKEKLYIPPAIGSKVVYIIDEVHMLTKEAFNALLKILEEPPEHAVFIFATTEAHKIPDTIRSRCTTVQFQQASDEEIFTALSQIVKAEKLKVEEAALQAISRGSDGSFRDGVKLFEQLIGSQTGKTLTEEDVIEKLGAIKSGAVAELIQTILSKDEKKVIHFFQTARAQNVGAVLLHKMIVQFLHTELMKALGAESGKPIASQQIVMYLLKQFSLVEIPLQHPMPLLPLELCALEMVLKSKEKGGQRPPGGVGVSGQGGADSATTGGSSTKKTNESVEKVTSTQKIIPEKFSEKLEANIVSNDTEHIVYQTNPDIDFIVPDAKPQISEATYSSMQSPETETTVQESLSTVDGTLVGEKWQDLLKMIGKKNLSLEAILRSAQFVRGETGKATIKVFYGFHKEQLELDRYRMVIDQAIRELAGGHVRLEYVLSSQAEKKLGDENANITGDMDQGLVSVIEEALL